MVNLATAISKIEDEINEEFDEDLEKYFFFALNRSYNLKIFRGSKKEDCQENRKNKATGLLMMFSWSRSVLSLFIRCSDTIVSSFVIVQNTEDCWR